VIVAIVAAETVVLALLTVLVAGLLRSHAEILRRLHALGAGIDSVDDGPIAPVLVNVGTRTRAQDVVGTGLNDDAMRLAVGGASHRTLLAFLSSGCLTCREFWDAFADVDRLELPDDVRLVVVVKDASEESVTALRPLAPHGIPVVLSSATWSAYEVPGSPYFVLVDGRAGRVRGEGTGTSWPQVRNLMLQASGDTDPDGTEIRIDRELLEYGVAPGDPSLYRTARELNEDAHA
jgi:hypothetical protein